MCITFGVIIAGLWLVVKGFPLGRSSGFGEQAVMSSFSYAYFSF
jgi:hypothetical protein